MDTASETWSHGGGSTTIIDTMSEPARYYGRDADKIRERSMETAAAANKSKQQPREPPLPPTKLMAKLSSGNNEAIAKQQQQKQQQYHQQTTGAATAAPTHQTKVKKQPVDPRSSISTASTSQQHKGSNSNNTMKSREGGGGGNSAAGGAAISGARSTTSSHQSERGAFEYLLANYHPGQQLSSVCSPRLPASTSSSRRQNNLQPPAAAAAAAAPTTTIVCRRDSTDPPPSSSSQKQFADMSMSGSSWSTYEVEGRLAKYDPPSRDEDEGGSSVSTGFDTSSSSIRRLRHQKKKKQLQQKKKKGRSNMASFDTLNEGDEDDDDGEEGGDDYVAQERRSITSNNSELQSMEDLEQDEDSSSSSSDDSDAIDESAELSSAVRMELGIRKKISNSTNTTSIEDDDDHDADVSRAIVTIAPTEQHRNDSNNKLYLASAVNNYTGLVPLNSTIYEAYDHTFVSCPEYLRFRFLFTFLKKNLEKKIMIFFSTTNSAKFHAKILAHFHIPVLVMHGKQHREKFINRFFKFSDMDEGILCATDAAGRDLDIPPSVDWVIQYEPPDDPSEYILRVARISCNSDRVGRSLLFLNPGEKGFLKYYHSASIPVSEFEIPKKNLAEVQDQYEYHVNESERVLRYARDAYGSYLIAYASHGFRDVYNVHDLNKDDVGVSFGLVRGVNIPDDVTADTDTLMNGTSSYVGGMELGHDPMMEVSKRRSNSGGGAGAGGRRWEKKEKRSQKTWMKGEKSWPHSSIKLHPKFKGGGSDVPESVRF
ncbi:hypothetical protein ACHAXH_005780 [Discostella pseudostelligera]